MATRSELIDAIIAKTAGWRGATLAKVRQIIHAADPGITEEVKWKRPRTGGIFGSRSNPHRGHADHVAHPQGSAARPSRA